MLKVAILRNAMTVDEDELWIEGYVVALSLILRMMMMPIDSVVVGP